MRKDYYCPLRPGNTYHLFNRAVGKECLFEVDDNYFYFLSKYAKHTKNVCDTFCYNLLPNHFHLLVRIKDEQTIASYFEVINGLQPPVDDQAVLSDFIMERFSNWLNAYTKAFNKMCQRKGGLFIDYTKRIQVCPGEDLENIIYGIHADPVRHGLVKKFNEWPHSSYNSLLSKAPTLLSRGEVMSWFGSKDQFIKFHQQPIDLNLSCGLE